MTAWCARENIGSQRVPEKAEMQFVNTEKNGLVVGYRVYDKQTLDMSGGFEKQI